MLSGQVTVGMTFLAWNNGEVDKSARIFSPRSPAHHLGSLAATKIISIKVMLLKEEKFLLVLLCCH